MKWNKDVIINDLSNLLPDWKVEGDEYGDSGYYCRTITVQKLDQKPKSGIFNHQDGISIKGFNDMDINYSSCDYPKEDVPLVEVKNFYADDRGGLSLTASKDIRNAYFVVVDYFNERRIEVVSELSDFF